MDELQRKLAIKTLFDSPGYKLFMEELDYVIIEVQDIQRSVEGMPVEGTVINFHNGRRTGLRAVTNILQGFREELDDTAEGR